MTDYRNFTLTDFLLDEDFIRWVQTADPGDEAFWAAWQEAHPDRRPILEEARKVLQCIDIRQEPIADEQVRLEMTKLLGAVNPPDRQASLQQVTERRLIPSLFKKAMAAAAVLAAITAIRFFYTSHNPAPQQFAYTSQTASKHLIERINSTGKPDSVTLSDGSRIWICPNSRISYSTGYDTAQVREIYLSGEAFFQVARHPRRPFRVITGEVVTKVLGTCFLVRSFEKDTTIQVTVKSGKVSVYAQNPHGARETAAGASSAPTAPDGIIVTCNQRIIYQKTGQKFQKMLLEQPAIVTPEMTDGNMVYEDTPIEQVFAQLSKAYGIGIMYDSELMKKCTVTADLKGETFYHKLDLICRAIGASYELIDGQVVIQSAGCQNPSSG